MSPKIEVPSEVVAEVAAETAKRNGKDQPQGQPPRASKAEKDRRKRLDSLVDGVTRNYSRCYLSQSADKTTPCFCRLPTGSSRSPSWRPAGWRRVSQPRGVGGDGPVCCD